MSGQPPLRLYYDGLIYKLYRQRTGGISRYFDALISHLPGHCRILLTSSRSQHLPHPRHPGLRIVHGHPFRRPAGFWRRATTFRYQIAASSLRPDLCHPTYYSFPSFLPHTRRPPLVYTVHDMIHELFPVQEDPTGKAAASKKACIDQADLLICVSDSTRHDLLRFYPHLQDRVRVVRHGCTYPLAAASGLGSEQVCPSLPAALSSVPYLLYVGSRN